MNKWIDYKPGTYQKKYYDIKTMARHTYYGCWPNAGMFHIDNGEQIDEHFILKAKLSRIDDMEMPIKPAQSNNQRKNK